MQISERTAESERDLIERARGDPEAFGVLYDRNVRRIYSYVYRRTGSRYEAEDVTSETFMRALEQIGRYQYRDIAFSCWLYRIASNLVAGHHRRQFPRTDLEEASGVRSEEPLPEEAILKRERAQELLEAVATLPRSQRQAIALKFSRGLRHREIGEALGCSEGAVKQLVYRAVGNLRRVCLPARVSPE